MRWVCPRCGSVLSVALSECPHCSAEETSAEPTAVRPTPTAVRPALPAPAPALPAQEVSSPAPPAEETRPAPIPSARSIRDKFLRPAPSVKGTAIPAEETEKTPFWRGVEMGVGFMLAVTIVLFLLSLLLFWFSTQGWQPWFERLLE